jgi:hypothetical protein
MLLKWPQCVCLSYANIRKFGFDNKTNSRTQFRTQWKDTEIWSSRGCDLANLCLLGECDAVQSGGSTKV